MVVREEVAPTFTLKPKIRQEDDGNKLIFECQLNSNPRPEIRWFRENILVNEDYRTISKITEYSPNKYTVSLVIDDVIESDAGTYKVLAKNKRGEVSASINLNFTRKYCFRFDRLAKYESKLKYSFNQSNIGWKFGLGISC